MKINFKWYRCADGYEIRELPNYEGPQIISRSDRMEICRPLDSHSAILRIISEIETFDNYIKFVSIYGLLTHRTKPESVKIISSFSKNISEMIEAYDKKKFNLIESYFNQSKVCKINLKLDTSLASPYLLAEPENLLQAIWIQFGVMVILNQGQEKCALCQKWFAVGLGTGRRKMRRNIKKSFCCGAHARRLEYITRGKY